MLEKNGNNANIRQRLKDELIALNGFDKLNIFIKKLKTAIAMKAVCNLLCPEKYG